MSVASDPCPNSQIRKSELISSTHDLISQPRNSNKCQSFTSMQCKNLEDSKIWQLALDCFSSRACTTTPFLPGIIPAMTKLQLLRDDAFEETRTSSYAPSNWSSSSFSDEPPADRKIKMCWTLETLMHVINKQTSEDISYAYFDWFEKIDAEVPSDELRYSKEWGDSQLSTHRRSDEVDKGLIATIFEPPDANDDLSRQAWPGPTLSKRPKFGRVDMFEMSKRLNETREAIRCAFMALFAMCRSTPDKHKRFQMNERLQSIIPGVVLLAEQNGVQVAAPFILAKADRCARILKGILEDK